MKSQKTREARRDGPPLTGNHYLLSHTTNTVMLVERLYLSSTIEVDKDGVVLIARACDKLSKGPYTVDELWPGRSSDLSS